MLAERTQLHPRLVHGKDALGANKEFRRNESSDVGSGPFIFRLTPPLSARTIRPSHSTPEGSPVLEV